MRQYIPAVRLVQMLLDISLVQACLYGLTVHRLEGEFPLPHQALVLISALLMLLVYQWQQVYQQFRAGGLRSELPAVLRAWATVLLMLAVLGFGTKTNTVYSHEILFGWAVLGAIAQLAAHLGTAYVIRGLRSRGWNQRRTVLVGDGGLARNFAAYLQQNKSLGIEVLGFVPTEEEPVSTLHTGVLPSLGTVERIAVVLQENRADLVYITLSLGRSSQVEVLLDTLLPLHVDVHWVPDISSLALLNHGVYELAGQPVLRLSDAPVVGLRRAGKWLVDMILATIFLIVASPLLLVIAIAVKFNSQGPVLFRQARIGRNGEAFITYKFRSMVIHDEVPGQLTQAVRGDVRLTRVGAFLRRNSLDELPQLINVLQGRMSIVGPRPHALEHDSYYTKRIRAYMLRHRVKPGITGWAQVNGWRGETDTPEKMQKRVECDLHYINNWSLSFDFLILAITLWQMLTGKNAW